MKLVNLQMLLVMLSLFIERVFRNIEGAGKWCDIAQFGHKSCSDIASVALDDALISLSKTLVEHCLL